MTGLFICESFGFLIYGRRLIRLMPRDFEHKMHKVTNVMNVMCVLFLTSWIAAVVNVVAANTVDGFMSGLFVARVFLIAVILVMMSILAGRVRYPRLLICKHCQEDTDPSTSSTITTTGSMSRPESQIGENAV